MAKRKRLTFEYSAGWLAHHAGKPFDESQSDDWKDGWFGRETYVRDMRCPRIL